MRETARLKRGEYGLVLEAVDRSQSMDVAVKKIQPVFEVGGDGGANLYRAKQVRAVAWQAHLGALVCYILMRVLVCVCVCARARGPAWTGVCCPGLV